MKIQSSLHNDSERNPHNAHTRKHNTEQAVYLGLHNNAPTGRHSLSTKENSTDIECSSRACGVPCCALPSLRAQITYCPPAPVDPSCVRVHAPPSPTHHSLHTFLPEGEKNSPAPLCS